MNIYQKGKLLLLIAILLLLSSLVFALNDDTLKEVDKLRWKHYGMGIVDLDCIGVYSPASSDIVWTRHFLSIRVEGDRLIIKTQDGKWFVEMTDADR